MEKIYLIPFQVPPTSSIGLDYPVKPFYRHWLIDSGPLPTPTFSIGLSTQTFIYPQANCPLTPSTTQ